MEGNRQEKLKLLIVDEINAWKSIKWSSESSAKKAILSLRSSKCSFQRKSSQVLFLMSFNLSASMDKKKRKVFRRAAGCELRRKTGKEAITSVQIRKVQLFNFSRKTSPEGESWQYQNGNASSNGTDFETRKFPTAKRFNWKPFISCLSNVADEAEADFYCGIQTDNSLVNGENLNHLMRRLNDPLNKRNFPSTAVAWFNWTVQCSRWVPRVLLSLSFEVLLPKMLRLETSWEILIATALIHFTLLSGNLQKTES